MVNGGRLAGPQSYPKILTIEHSICTRDTRAGWHTIDLIVCRKKGWRKQLLQPSPHNKNRQQATTAAFALHGAQQAQLQYQTPLNLRSHHLLATGDLIFSNRGQQSMYFFSHFLLTRWKTVRCKYIAYKSFSIKHSTRHGLKHR